MVPATRRAGRAVVLVASAILLLHGDRSRAVEPGLRDRHVLRRRRARPARLAARQRQHVDRHREGHQRGRRPAGGLPEPRARRSARRSSGRSSSARSRRRSRAVSPQSTLPAETQAIVNERTEGGVAIVPASSVPEIATDAGLSGRGGGRARGDLRRVAALVAAHRVLRAHRARPAVAARLARHPGRRSAAAPEARRRSRFGEIASAAARTRVGYRGTVTTDAAAATPPVATRNPIVRSHHGDDVEDAYEWFRAKEDAAVIAHLEAENAYTQSARRTSAGLQEKIFDEIKGRTLETDLSVPTRRGDWWYYGRTVEGSSTASSAAHRSPRRMTGPRRSSRPMSRSTASRSCSTATSRPRATSSSRSAASRSPPTATGCCTASTSPATSATRSACATSSPASSCRRDPRHVRRRDLLPRRPVHLLHDRRRRLAPRHRLAARARHPVADDVKLFHEPDERFWVGAGFTRSDRYLVIGMGSSITSEEWLVDAADLRSAPRLVWPRTEGVEYDSSPRGHRRRGRAVHPAQRRRPRFRARPGLGIRPHRAARSRRRPSPRASACSGVSTFRDWGVLGYRRGGPRAPRDAGLRDGRRLGARLRRAAVLGRLGAATRSGLPRSSASATTRSSRPAPCSTTTSRRASCCCASASRCWAATSAADYAQARDWATAQDGTQMPISLVWKRSFGDAGAAPRAAAPLRLRLVRALDRPGLLGAAPVGARPRRHLRGRARARRRRDGPSVVRGRQAAAQAQHVHRLRGLRAAPGRAGVHDRRPDGRRGRLGRRPADGRGRQPRPGAVRRHPRRRAVRRRAHHRSSIRRCRSP